MKRLKPKDVNRIVNLITYFIEVGCIWNSLNIFNNFSSVGACYAIIAIADNLVMFMQGFRYEDNAHSILFKRGFLYQSSIARFFMLVPTSVVAFRAEVL